MYDDDSIVNKTRNRTWDQCWYSSL